MLLKPGDRIDRYVVEALLGEGGMGAVYAARDTVLGRRVALKLLRGGGAGAGRNAAAAGVDDAARARLVREARTAAAFEHPGAAAVYDVGEAEGAPFLAMELVRGRSLRGFVGDAGSAGVEQRLRWLVDTARVLAAAHRAGIVHRDVKPDNVMVREDGAVKVLDFGIARLRAPADPSAPTADPFGTITAEGALVGTPLYMAPEQLSGEAVDGHADQFAWGVTAYELLTGASPWAADNPWALVRQIVEGTPRPMRERAATLPEGVETVVLRALQKRPAERFETLDAAADALEPFAASVGAASSPLTPGRSPGPVALAPTEAAPSPTSGTPSAPAEPSASEVFAETRPAALPEGPSPSSSAPAARPPPRGRTALVAAAVASLAAVGIAASWGRVAVRQPTAPSAESPLAPRPRVAAVGCEAAEVTGEGGPPELGRAFGMGACARLGVELGVPWGERPEAPRLEVKVALRKDGASTSVALALAGRRAVADDAKSPAEAMDEAVRRLAKELEGPALSPEEVRGWGAKDAESARRIRRLWWREALGFELVEDEVRRLVAAGVASPWLHALLLEGETPDDRSPEDRRKARALAVELPEARALALQGALLRAPDGGSGPGDDLLRRAFSEAPSDPEVQSLFGMPSCLKGPELASIAEQVYERSPGASIPVLRCAVTFVRDPERWQRALDHLGATLPEALGTQVYPLLHWGREGEARAAIAVTQALHGRAASDLPAETSLALLEPAAARRAAEEHLGDPSIALSAQAADLVIAADLMAGRVLDAESELIAETSRLRAAHHELETIDTLVLELKIRRWLGHLTSPTLERFAWLSHTLEKPGGDPRATAMARTELALAGARAHPSKAEAARALAAIEALADADAQGDPMSRARRLLYTLPLVRVARGDAAAARLYRETPPGLGQHYVAFEAGLAFEAAGDLDDAARAYVLAQDVYGAAGKSFELIAARAHLADLHRKAGRLDEAAALDAVVDRVWAKANPGLREAVRRMR